MQKRGQITIFIVVGIFIVATIILVAVLKGGTIKNAIEKGLSSTGSLDAVVDDVNSIIQGCFDKAMQESFRRMAVGKFNDYSKEFGNILESELLKCVNYDSIQATVVASDIDNLNILISPDSTQIKAEMKYNVLIKKDNEVRRLDTFYSQLSIIPQCCIPVEVGDGCLAVRSVKAISCGRIFDITAGESLDDGGKCGAC